MSARKLSRLAGLVFALAVFVGGVAAASVDGASASAEKNGAVEIQTLSVEWD